MIHPITKFDVVAVLGVLTLMLPPWIVVPVLGFSLIWLLFLRDRSVRP